MIDSVSDNRIPLSPETKEVAFDFYNLDNNKNIFTSESPQSSKIVPFDQNIDARSFEKLGIPTELKEKAFKLFSLLMEFPSMTEDKAMYSVWKKIMQGNIGLSDKIVNPNQGLSSADIESAKNALDTLIEVEEKKAEESGLNLEAIKSEKEISVLSLAPILSLDQLDSIQQKTIEENFSKLKQGVLPDDISNDFFDIFGMPSPSIDLAIQAFDQLKDRGVDEKEAFIHVWGVYLFGHANLENLGVTNAGLEGGNGALSALIHIENTNAESSGRESISSKESSYKEASMYSNKIANTQAKLFLDILTAIDVPSQERHALLQQVASQKDQNSVKGLVGASLEFLKATSFDAQEGYLSFEKFGMPVNIAKRAANAIESLENKGAKTDVAYIAVWNAFLQGVQDKGFEGGRDGIIHLVTPFNNLKPDNNLKDNEKKSPHELHKDDQRSQWDRLLDSRLSKEIKNTIKLPAELHKKNQMSGLLLNALSQAGVGSIEERIEILNKAMQEGGNSKVTTITQDILDEYLGKVIFKGSTNFNATELFENLGLSEQSITMATQIIENRVASGESKREVVDKVLNAYIKGIKITNKPQLKTLGVEQGGYAGGNMALQALHNIVFWNPDIDYSMD